ncbi:DUF2889 domain-containing protein [Hydrocarboniphaga sp.]|uniref:DUF2889 domain-containing protein n=1 Tax=Hydrocarboniphaga sp. TaxID=2033016 RepID=UPI00260EA991|nr:DUF2889 domain-containing protein [Hydrocarboniphaga sp.]
MSWPEGRAGNARLIGRARDIVTPDSGGSPLTCAEDAFEAWLKLDLTIVAIEAQPPRPALARLAGTRVGSGLRQALAQAAPEERRLATPLYLILDDIAGTSLVSSWAWSHWNPNWLAEVRAAFSNSGTSQTVRTMEGVCIGMVPGSSAFDPHRERDPTPVPELRNPDDPEGWHAFTVQDGAVGMRRARRIDVWREQGVIVIDSAFQDSATTPAGGRMAVHEYRLHVTADPRSLWLLSAEADARVLPHPECTAAAANLSRLLGSPLPALREKVLAELRGTAGCTHLNDAMRALAEVPALLKHLDDRPAP